MLEKNRIVAYMDCVRERLHIENEFNGIKQRIAEKSLASISMN